MVFRPGRLARHRIHRRKTVLSDATARKADDKLRVLSGCEVRLDGRTHRRTEGRGSPTSSSSRRSTSGFIETDGLEPIGRGLRHEARSSNRSGLIWGTAPPFSFDAGQFVPDRLTEQVIGNPPARATAASAIGRQYCSAPGGRRRPVSLWGGADADPASLIGSSGHEEHGGV